jgi:menaquinone-specific isochorismate synthase
MEHFSDSMAWLAKRDGSLVIGHGPFQESSEPGAGVSFYVQNFALSDPQPWKTPARIERLGMGEHLGIVQESLPFDGAWETLDAARFSVVFQEIMKSIHEGVFEKTVPVVAEIGQAGPGASTAIMRAMLLQRSPLYSYGWVHGHAGFAGATPELLFSLAENRLETMALAGTARSEDRDVFAVDQKEIREHEYVAQSLVSKLLGLGHVERCAREILDLGSIVHFLTHIGLELITPKTPEELLRRLHPTPALGPLPRTSETLAMLDGWRSRLGCPTQFGAPFGLMDSGQFHAVVAIRGIWWQDRELTLPAGCGIIEASRLVNEWRELRLKREAVKRFLLPPT